MRFDVPPSAQTHFSWLRTRLSLERTLMSWVRTAVALIGFGFIIFQFGERLPIGPGAQPITSRHLALAFIGVGVLALAIALYEYRWLLRYLWGREFAPIAGAPAEPWRTPVTWVAILLLLTGLFAFATIALRG